MREHQKEGNLESFEACSQGAGRGMSRRVAKHAFSLADHIKATEGVECRKEVDETGEKRGGHGGGRIVQEGQAGGPHVRLRWWTRGEPRRWPHEARG
jgi:RNA-splicing ligase RtcB